MPGIVQSDFDWGNPPVSLVLEAVPRLQWRRCWDCDYVGVYSDATLPECNCHACGSADTRLMRAATSVLQSWKKRS
jgi:hypothetical protein